MYNISNSILKEVCMGQQINVNIRMDSDVKESADQLFSTLGFNLTTAVNAFVRQALRERAIPFQIRDTEPAKLTRDEYLAMGWSAIKSIQEDSFNNGTDKMTMDDIDALIAKSRRERKAKA
jgi:addiction module RelB/DinJ family antitoxin